MSSRTEILAQLQAIVKGMDNWPRAPIWHWPEEAGLEYESVSFPAEDGIILEGWYMPCKGSDKIIICSTPRWFNRGGMPSHLEPWNTLMPGNDYDVNFVNDYKILHDAGYNVFAYDLRNFGHSSSANGGVMSGGIYESRDVVGAIQYIRGREDTGGMMMGLFSRCNGAVSTFNAMHRRPELFEGIRCMLAPQPLSIHVLYETLLETLKIPASYIEHMDHFTRMSSGYSMKQMQGYKWAEAVKVPTLMWQVHDDPATKPKDVQTFFDAIPAEKEIHWIRDTTVRWDGYSHFQREPKQSLGWLERFMV